MSCPSYGVAWRFYIAVASNAGRPVSSSTNSAIAVGAMPPQPLPGRSIRFLLPASNAIDVGDQALECLLQGARVQRHYASAGNQECGRG